MTVNELLTEIVTRAGEGYENWIDRAKSAFKQACVQLSSLPQFTHIDYPIMILSNTYINDGGTPVYYIPVSSIITSDYELLSYEDMQFYYWDSDSSAYLEPVKCEIVSRSEYKAYELNNSLKTTGQKIMYPDNHARDGLRLIITFGIDDMLAFTIKVWSDNWLKNTTVGTVGEEGYIDYGAYVIDTYWSLPFLESAINQAVSILRAEIER